QTCALPIWRWNDASSPLAGCSNYPGISDGMKMRGRDRRSESHQKRQRVEVEGEGAVAEGALELQAHQVVRHQADVLSCDRRAKDVLAECFTTDGVVCSGGGRGMQREAACGGAESLGMLEVAARAQADGVLLPQCGTGGAPARGGGRGEPGERRLRGRAGFRGVTPAD